MANLERKVLDERISALKAPKMYIPSTIDLGGLYGHIDVYGAEKTFASAKCCMCCH